MVTAWFSANVSSSVKLFLSTWFVGVEIHAPTHSYLSTKTVQVLTMKRNSKQAAMLAWKKHAETLLL